MNNRNEKNNKNIPAVTAGGEELPEKDRRRNLRRIRSLKADSRRRRIVELHRYYPKAGHYRYDFIYDPLSKRTIAVADKRYIQYPKDSKGEQYLKNLSNRRVRRLAAEDIWGKGNIYRRFFDYQWAVD